MDKPIVAITMGDAAGVGPELIVKVLSRGTAYESCYPLVIGDPEVLVDSIRQVFCGNSSLHPSVARALLEEVARGQEGSAAGDVGLGSALVGEVETLTEREAQVLGLIARGWSNQSIADELTISCATVRTHVSHILAKLNLASRTQAALYALRRGWASLQDAEPPSFR